MTPIVAIVISLAALGATPAAAQRSQRALGVTSDLAVTFVSAESSASTGTPITNRITRQVNGAVETWTMRQKQSASAGDDPNYWSHFAIIVDHAQRPARATFREYEPKPVLNHQPIAITPRVACLRCHPNGARAIRPAAGTLPLSAAARRQIAAWNQSIARDGVVKANVTAAIAFEPPGTNAPLDLPACVSCHDDAGGVRGTLTRAHAASIDFLTRGEEAAAMPLKTEDTRALSFLEREMLQDWLAGKEVLPLRITQGQDDGPELHLKSGSVPNLTTGSVPRLTATIETNIGNVITATNIRTTPNEEFSEWTIDLTAVTTGNVWRDEHLQRWLRDAKATRAVFKVPNRLIWAGISRAVVMTPVCARAQSGLTCTLTGVTLALTDFGLTPPSFLAVRVLPKIRLNGTFLLTGAYGDSRDDLGQSSKR